MIYANQYRRSNLFDPRSNAPFKISRSKIDFFLECARCFYLDRRLGVSRPSLPGFTLNIAVDHLLKKEFDIHRAKKTAHPLMEKYGISATPFNHPQMEKWQENFVGVQYLHQPTNFLVFGAVDDLWINSKQELHVVDYKATSKNETPTLDGRWGEQYKRQVEVYQWLMRHNDFKVSDTAYFVYVNGRKDRAAFDARLEFDVMIISHTGSDKWVEGVLEKIRSALEGDIVPAAGRLCEHCPYVEERNKALQESVQPVHKSENEQNLIVKSRPQSPDRESKNGRLFG